MVCFHAPMFKYGIKHASNIHLHRLLRRAAVRRRSSSSSSSREDDADDELPRAISRLINASPTTPWPPQLETALSPLASGLTPSIILRTLDLLSSPSTSAIPLFQWSRPYLPLSDTRPAAKTLHLLLRSRSLHQARSFLLSIPSASLPNHSFNALIRALAHSGRLRHAIDLFRSIPSPTSFSYNALLSALLRRGRTRSALRLYRHMLRSGGSPDVCTFNTLIRGFCLNSMVGEGFRFFRDMSIRGVLPDVITYNTLLDGLCRAGELRVAHNLLDGMRSKSPGLAPNIVSYTTLIRGYCNRLCADEAVALLDEMVAAGIKPNRITYNTLIQGLCEAGTMDKVKEILEQADFRPDTCTFNTLIAGHCNSGRVGEALKVFDRMLEMRVQADSATYSTLIRGLCGIGDFKRAGELVDELLEKSVVERRGGAVPLIAAYNPIFEHLCLNGKSEKARRLFRQLLERKGKVDVVAFRTLIQGHCKEGDLKEGYRLLSSMTRRDLKLDIRTYEVLIEGLLANRNARLAWKTLEKMLGSGHRPSTSMYHVVLAALLSKDGHPKEAGSLVSVMLERKIRLNIDLSTEVIAYLFRNRLNDRAFEMVGLLYDNGYCVKVEQLVGCLCQDQKFLVARELLLFSLETQQNLGSEVCSMVISGLCATGEVLEAFRLFCEVIDKGAADVVSHSLDNLKHALQVEGRLKEAEFVSKQMNHESSLRPLNHNQGLF